MQNHKTTTPNAFRYVAIRNLLIEKAFGCQFHSATFNLIESLVANCKKCRHAFEINAIKMALFSSAVENYVEKGASGGRTHNNNQRNE